MFGYRPACFELLFDLCNHLIVFLSFHKERFALVVVSLCFELPFGTLAPNSFCSNILQLYTSIFGFLLKMSDSLFSRNKMKYPGE